MKLMIMYSINSVSYVVIKLFSVVLPIVLVPLFFYVILHLYPIGWRLYHEGIDHTILCTYLLLEVLHYCFHHLLQFSKLS